MLLSHQGWFFISACLPGSSALGPDLSRELSHLSLGGMDLRWSEGQQGPFVFTNNEWASRAPEGLPVPEYRSRPLPTTPQCPLHSCRQAVEVDHQIHRAVTAASQASESCKKVLEEVLEAPAGARGLCPHSTVVLLGAPLFSLWIASWSTERVSDSSRDV